MLGLLLIPILPHAQAGFLRDKIGGPLDSLARLLPGWTFGGDIDLGLSMPLGKRRDGMEGWMRFSFRNGRFSNSQETILGDGLRGVVRVGGGWPSGDQIPVKAEVSVLGGEVLLDRWYLNIGPNPLKIHFSGTWHPKERSLKGIQGTLEWGDLVRASWEGTMSGLGRQWKGRLRAAVELPSHKALFNWLLPQLTAQWREFSMGGQSRCLLDIEASEGGLVLNGKLLLEDTEIHNSAKGIAIQGLTGGIPFQLPLGKVDGKMSKLSEISGNGELVLKEVKIGALRLDDLRLYLISSPNGLNLAKPLELPLFHGKVVAREVKLQEIMPLPPRVVLRLKAEGLDLGELAQVFTPFDLKGKVDGEFPQIVIEKGDLRSQGGAHIDVWGGQIILEGLWGEMIFSKRRRLGVEVTMKDLDMEQATQSLGFGQMGGIMGGEIKRLAFSFGQPESLELWIRSVPRSGVKQYVDAKAVENLSILSSGAAVRTPLLRLFKFYPYSKLGIYCKLENDMFTLRGTVVEGGKKYMIKRAFLRGIDVIPPENPNIPWRDMLQRVRRIFPKEGQKVRIEMGH